MSDISETNLVSTASSTIERYVEVVAIVIKDTVQEYGPEAFNMLLWITRIDNIQVLFFGMIALTVTYLSFKYSRKFLKEAFYCAKEANEANSNERYNRVKETPADFVQYDLSILMFCVTIIAAIITYECLLNVWVWIGVIKPELYLAKQALELAIESIK